MGVDATMYVIPRNKTYTKDELIYLSYRIGEAVGPRSFMLFNDDNDCHALSIETEYVPEQFEREKQVISVNLIGRYYGPGYERGPLFDYIAVAIWLEKNLGLTPYYGGDSGGVELELFDAKKREEYINHWAKVGGIPYRGSFGMFGGNNDNIRPTCPRCKVLANQFGWGGNYAAWSCLGCNKQWYWRGEAVIEGKEER